MTYARAPRGAPRYYCASITLRLSSRRYAYEPIRIVRKSKYGLPDPTRMEIFLDCIAGYRKAT
jgi:hypothetical protein